MRKYLLLFGVIISIGIPSFASKYDVCMEYHQLGQGTQSTTVRRSPLRLPIDVLYDSETHQIEVVGDEDVVAQTFLCDENGNVLDYSPSINAVLQIPSNYSGLIIIRIENEDWSAIGEMAV